MTQAEKAKAYDEAIEKSKEFYILCKKCGAKDTVDFLEEIFPELKESEDEKIRKEIISHLKYLGRYCQESMPNVNEWIAWLEKQGQTFTKKDVDDAYLKGVSDTKHELEKQGEQKPYDQRKECLDCQFNYAGECKGSCQMKRGEQKSADKVEPKFKVGEWVTNGLCAWRIDSIEEDIYYTNHCGIDCGGDIESIDKEYHLWTIQDAKDGDVLACNEEILLFKSYSVQGRISLYCWYNGQTNNFHSKEVVDTLMTTRNKICPATKEQRDTLIKAMADAGYTFDFKKKQLKLLITNGDDFFESENCEQKHVEWSEEDERICQCLIEDQEEALDKVEVISNLKKMYEERIDWLKSLKQRIGG